MLYFDEIMSLSKVMLCTHYYDCSMLMLVKFVYVDNKRFTTISVPDNSGKEMQEIHFKINSHTFILCSTHFKGFHGFFAISYKLFDHGSC